MRVLGPSGAIVLLSMLAVGCAKKPGPGASVPSAQAPRAVVAPSGDVLPFAGPPTVALVDRAQPGPVYQVQLAVSLVRDVMPTDDLAFVVSVGDHEIGRYPVVATVERGQRATARQEIELPLGSYEVDLAYRGVRYAATPFRLADVPVWGGRRQLQIRSHPGTRISLRQKTLWVARWWANDGPPPAWIVEWRRDGQIVTTTSGRERHGIDPKASTLVGGASFAFRGTREIDQTLWTFGESYPVPDVVAQTPGAWAAIIVHGGAPPLAVTFDVRAPGQVAGESDKLVVVGPAWQRSWSRPLPSRGLSPGEVGALAAKLPHVEAHQPFDTAPSDGVEPAIRVTPAAVRALFRSSKLAETWQSYLMLNAQAAQAQGAQTATAKDRAKLRAMRPQIEQLIKAHGGRWLPDEAPRS
jgi:hypothetical protein